jgi:hypothetical protein
MPTSREDTVFVFFPSAFFQALISPQYQIELRRRLQAVTDLELVQLAKWAAWAEGKPSATIADLVQGELLPAGFGLRPDGSGPIIAGDEVIDSLRGARGSFVPIPDVELQTVTRDEASRFLQQSQFYGDTWQQMDPLMVGVKRYALDDKGKERVVIDAHVSPFAEEKYGWIMSLLGPPTYIRIKPARGDIITAQAVVKGGLLLPGIPLHHLFVGVQDNDPLTDLQPDSLLKTLMILRTTPGYLGAWPKPGFLDLLPFGLGGGPPDAYGYSQLPLGIWRRQWEGFSALALDGNLLARVTPDLVPEETEDGAQIRAHVGDLSQAKLQTWVNQMAYSRAYRASLGNARLLHALSQQLGVPREQSLVVAESLLDALVVCTLGGGYRLSEQPGQASLWKSTAWPKPPTQGVPADYQAPLLGWFRGLDASLTKHPDRIVVHAQFDMQRKPGEPKVELPFFNLFGGGQKKPEKDPAAEKPAEIVKPPPPNKSTGPREF